MTSGKKTSGSRGGARPGSGRKKLGYPTRVLYATIPLDTYKKFEELGGKAWLMRKIEEEHRRLNAA